MVPSAQHSDGGNGIYCIVDTFTKADNLVIELKSHIIVLHPMFLIRKNVSLLTCWQWQFSRSQVCSGCFI